MQSDAEVDSYAADCFTADFINVILFSYREPLHWLFSYSIPGMVHRLFPYKNSTYPLQQFKQAGAGKESASLPDPSILRRACCLLNGVHACYLADFLCWVETYPHMSYLNGNSIAPYTLFLQLPSPLVESHMDIQGPPCSLSIRRPMHKAAGWDPCASWRLPVLGTCLSSHRSAGVTATKAVLSNEGQGPPGCNPLGGRALSCGRRGVPGAPELWAHGGDILGNAPFIGPPFPVSHY